MLKRIPLESERDSLQYLVELMGINQPIYVIYSRLWRQFFVSDQPITFEDVRKVYGEPKIDDYLSYYNEDGVLATSEHLICDQCDSNSVHSLERIHAKGKVCQMCEVEMAVPEVY